MIVMFHFLIDFIGLCTTLSNDHKVLLDSGSSIMMKNQNVRNVQLDLCTILVMMGHQNVYNDELKVYNLE